MRLAVTSVETRQATLSEVWAARWPTPAWAQSLVLPLAFSLIVALGAQISIPLRFTPVPITGQTFGVLLTGLVLGPRRGALALCLYLLEGGCGLPFFAGGAGGWAKLIGPTGGYLISYPLAAGLVGHLARRGWDRRPGGAFAAMLAGSGVIFALGAAWLSRWAGGLENAVIQGVLPFLPGDLLKTLLASALLPTAWRLTSGDRNNATGK